MLRRLSGRLAGYSSAWPTYSAPSIHANWYSNVFQRNCSALAGTGTTTFALATGEGKAAIAVVRLSGPHAKSALHALTKDNRVPSPRLLKFQKLYCPSTGVCLDHAMTAWFPAPHSYTGEDMLELHLHGGRAVVHAVQRTLSALPVCCTKRCNTVFRSGCVFLSFVRANNNVLCDMCTHVHVCY